MQTHEPQNTNEHLANERTFLAWVRTSIGIMAFGFVVVKFSLFVKQVSMLLSKQPVTAKQGWSGIIGVSLVAAGAFCLLLSFIQFKKTARQINERNYRSGKMLTTLLTLFILVASVLLIVYLVDSL
jgi:putative membrane protein